MQDLEIAQVGSLDMGIGVITLALHLLPYGIGNLLSREMFRKILALHTRRDAKPEQYNCQFGEIH
jgi:hypothetical protein